MRRITLQIQLFRDYIPVQSYIWPSNCSSAYSASFFAGHSSTKILQVSILYDGATASILSRERYSRKTLQLKLCPKYILDLHY